MKKQLLRIQPGSLREARRDPGSTRSRLQAENNAFTTARALGPDWTPTIHYNLLWHGKAVSKCGRWKVSPTVHKGKIIGWTAFLGEKGFPGGDWAEHGSTPVMAVAATVAAVQAQLQLIKARLTYSPDVIGFTIAGHVSWPPNTGTR